MKEKPDTKAKSLNGLMLLFAPFALIVGAVAWVISWIFGISMEEASQAIMNVVTTILESRK